MEMTSATSGYVSSKSTTYDRSTNRPKSGWAEWEMAVDLDTIQSHMPDASNTSTLSLAQAVASFSRSELRWEVAIIAAAVALLTVALAAIALFFFRRRTRDLTLVYVGVFSILYAVRLLVSRQIGRAHV